MKKVLSTVAIFALMPFLAFAADPIPTGGLETTVSGIQRLINMLVPILIAIAFIAFIVGIIKYLWAGGAEAKAKAKDQLIWGIVSIIAIVAVFGIAQLFIRVFDLQPVQLQTQFIPGVQTTNQ